MKCSDIGAGEHKKTRISEIMVTIPTSTTVDHLYYHITVMNEQKW
jgi:hypothetical protein